MWKEIKGVSKKVNMMFLLGNIVFEISIALSFLFMVKHLKKKKDSLLTVTIYPCIP